MWPFLSWEGFLPFFITAGYHHGFREETEKLIKSQKSFLDLSTQLMDQRKEVQQLNQKLTEKSEYIENYLRGGKGHPTIKLVQQSLPDKHWVYFFVCENTFDFPLYNIHIEIFDYDKVVAKSIFKDSKIFQIGYHEYIEARVVDTVIAELSPQCFKEIETKFKLGNKIEKYYVRISTRSISTEGKIVFGNYAGKPVTAYSYKNLDGTMTSNKFPEKTSVLVQESIKKELEKIPFGIEFSYGEMNQIN